MENLFYAKTEISGRTIDLILTEDQILQGVKQALQNCDLICQKNPGSCWPVEKPQECPLWRKIFGVCACKS